MNNQMMMLMQLMPLMQSFQGGGVSLKDVLAGRGKGAAIRSQLLTSLPGNIEAKTMLLAVLERADKLAAIRRTDVLDVLLGSTADVTLMDDLKKGLRKL